MNARLANSNTVSQQKSPLFLVVRDINEGEQKSIFIKNDPNEELSDQSDDESESHLQQAQVAFFDNKECDSGLIWSHRKPTENDSHATEYFLQIRGSEKYKTLFVDKKYGKYRLWSEIAEEMNNAGFYVGEGREAAERCRQKFSNLEKGFLNYVKHIRSGNRKRDPPPFYDLMVNLVDPDDKLYKQEQNALIDAVRDSLQVELVTATSKDNLILPSSSSKAIDNIPELNHFNFQPQPEKFKKSKQKTDIISLLSKQHAEMMKMQREYLEKLDKHLTVQNEQRERMISSFIEAMKETPCNCQRRKRKYSSSSESDPAVI